MKFETPLLTQETVLKNKEYEEYPSVYKGEDGQWYIVWPECELLPVPHALARHLGVASYIQFLHIQNRVEKSRTPYQTAARFHSRFDCHIFVALCLGFPIKLTDLKSQSYTAYKHLIEPNEFEEHSYFSLSKVLTQFEERVLVGQVQILPNDLTHSFFLVRPGNEWYTIEKCGKGGMLKIRPLKEALDAWKLTYGTRIAVAPYGEIAKREDLKDFYQVPHYTG